MQDAPKTAAVLVAVLIAFAPEHQPHAVEAQPGTYITAPAVAANSVAQIGSSNGTTWVWVDGRGGP